MLHVKFAHPRPNFKDFGIKSYIHALCSSGTGPIVRCLTDLCAANVGPQNVVLGCAISTVTVCLEGKTSFPPRVAVRNGR